MILGLSDIEARGKSKGTWSEAMLVKLHQDIEAKQQELEDKEKENYSVEQVIEEWKNTKSASEDQTE